MGGGWAELSGILLSNVVVFTGRVGGPGLLFSCLPGSRDKAESGDEGENG